MADEVAIWNRRYANPQHNERIAAEPWSGTWRAVADGVPRGRALDLGCGLGFDTEHLLALGFSVTAVDFSEAAVEASRVRNPNACHVVADIRELPDDLGDPFHLILANLSLHYFERADTEAIFGKIPGWLSTQGIFLFRLNAEDEAGAPADISSWKLVTVGGVRKQFFDQEKILGLLENRFDLLRIEKRASDRFGARKSLYEVAARKARVAGCA